MWILKKLCAPERSFYILSKKGSYSVGRKNGDIVMDEDASISRHHCTIKIAKRGECPFAVDTPTGIWVIDDNSKYGTFIKEKDWVKIAPNVVRQLQNNTIIRFGVVENLYRVEYKPITVCTSLVSDEQKEEFKKLLSLIDGRFLNDFDKNCSMMIVNKVTLTKKVVLSMIYGVPVVTPDYLKELVRSIQDQTPKPKYEDCKPEIGELALTASLVMLNPLFTRKQLFKGKIFLVPSKKQYDSLKDIIAAAGGKLEILREDSNWDQLGGDNIIIIKYQGNAAIDIVNFYKRNIEMYRTKYGKRIIPENEIPQAIAYSSIEQFCNPKCLNFGVRRDSGEMSRGEIIEGETPIFTEDSVVGRGVVASSSQSQSDSSQSQSTLGSTSRKRDHSPDNLGSAKKRALNEHDSNTPDGVQFKVPAPKKQTSLLNFISAKNIEKPSTSSSPISQSILSTTNNKLDDYREMPSVKSTKRKANVEEVPAKRTEPSAKKTRVSSVTFEARDEPSTSKNIPAKNKSAAQNNNKPLVNTSKDSIFNSSSYSKSIVEDVDDDDEKWIVCKPKSEPKEEPEDFNATVVLLSLVSINFTKENGSVAEPPSGLKNVKIFKKQKLLVPTNRIVPIEIIEDDNDWSGALSKSSQAY